MPFSMMLVFIVFGLAAFVAAASTSTIAVMLALSLNVALLIWFTVVNEWTCRERRRMITLYHARPDWQELEVLWHAVTYHDHMWRRITLQDPWAIYDPRLRSLLE